MVEDPFSVEEAEIFRQIWLAVLVDTCVLCPIFSHDLIQIYCVRQKRPTGSFHKYFEKFGYSWNF